MKRLFVNAFTPVVMVMLALSLTEPPVVAQPSEASAHPAKTQPSAEGSSGPLDRMLTAGKSQRELAQYIFNTHGCKNCHTVGHDGKLGFTAAGRQKAQGYEGCISMLTAMTVIVQVPGEQRSSSQREKAQRFEEFGCTSCHNISPGKLGLTTLGTKLTNLHLGCVEVEKLMSSKAP